MTPEKFFHELLGLGLNWKVDECEFKREEGVVLLAICAVMRRLLCVLNHMLARPEFVPTAGTKLISGVAVPP